MQPRAIVLSLAIGTVAVASGLCLRDAASMPDAVRIPIVAPPHPAGTPAAAALFRHSTHGQYGCFGCHPATFPRHREGFTHAQMQEGRYCGSCHDGSSAAPISAMTCEGCHAGR